MHPQVDPLGITRRVGNLFGRARAGRVGLHTVGIGVSDLLAVDVCIARLARAQVVGDVVAESADAVVLRAVVAEVDLLVVRRGALPGLRADQVAVRARATLVGPGIAPVRLVAARVAQGARLGAVIEVVDLSALDVHHLDRRRRAHELDLASSAITHARITGASAASARSAARVSAAAVVVLAVAADLRRAGVNRRIGIVAVVVGRRPTGRGQIVDRELRPLTSTLAVAIVVVVRVQRHGLLPGASGVAAIAVVVLAVAANFGHPRIDRGVTVVAVALVADVASGRRCGVRAVRGVAVGVAISIPTVLAGDVLALALAVAGPALPAPLGPVAGRALLVAAVRLVRRADLPASARATRAAGSAALVDLPVAVVVEAVAADLVHARVDVVPRVVAVVAVADVAGRLRCLVVQAVRCVSIAVRIRVLAVGAGRERALAHAVPTTILEAPLRPREAARASAVAGRMRLASSTRTTRAASACRAAGFARLGVPPSGVHRTTGNHRDENCHKQ